jgi:cholesterol oxidase
MKDVRFTEEMVGWYTPGSPAYDAGYHTGRLTDHQLRFHLTIGTDDLAALRADPAHRAEAVGWVRCPSLGPGEMEVRDGTFDLFAWVGSGRRVMRYRLGFRAAGGERYVLAGFKDIAHDRPFDLWRDTTTLYVKLLRATPDPPEEEIGRGILRLTPWMFLRQVTTFRGRPASVARFASGFMTVLLREYARPVRGGALS